MTTPNLHPRLRHGAIGIWLLFSLVALSGPATGRAQNTLPAALSDREFWALTEQFSEPDGFFRSNSGSSDNLLSNETLMGNVATAVTERVKPSGVYLGVGPEQNFTYIAATRPAIAFVTDIRRGNLHLHLLYKALFELSADRVDFVARLFSRTRPAGLTNTASASQLMTAFLRAEPLDEAQFAANLKAVTDRLTRTRSLPLQTDDLAGIEYVYRHFHRFGPGINYTSSITGQSGTGSTYAVIMGLTGAGGEERSYLANDANFTFVKSMQAKNLIVPVVGDFAGVKALRALGAYLKERGAIVSAFYVSNVESYLERNGVWQRFCANVAAMPLDAASVFIRPGEGQARVFGPMVAETAACSGN